MKGYILDFKTVEDPKEFTGISDQVLRQLEDDTIVLQLFSRTSPTISIGYDDTKSPHFDQGVDWLRSQGYKVGIRGAGGRAVVNDEGILNLSLMFKATMTPHEQYQYFYNFMQDALKPLNINLELGLVEGAYCPGTYDISINERKVSGTSSRVVLNNALVGGYLSVNGDQKQRSEVISRFYEITDDVIRVQPNKMTTIEEEIGREISFKEVKNLIIDHFHKIAEDVKPYDTSHIAKEDIDASAKRSDSYNRKYLK